MRWLIELLWPPARLARIQAELDERERAARRDWFPHIYFADCARRQRERGWSEDDIELWAACERARLAAQGIYPPRNGR